MSDFQDMLLDRVTHISQNGERTEGIPANVSEDTVIICQSLPIIRAGDELVRIASNGLEERMRVVDPGFYEAWEGIEAHYQSKVVKSERYQPGHVQSAPPAITSHIYNINGANARVNLHSIDRSTNIATQVDTSKELISALRKAVDDLALSTQQVEETADAIEVIEAQFESQTPKVGMITKMVELLPNVAAVVDIGSKLVDLAKSFNTN
jgi:hypothetical protein